MSIIKTLDEHLTNMIAAGEVVERPMGVVKELVENSLDAQAGSIDVLVVDGGCQSIEVRDDGCGMDQTDATKAFNRHATSKISRPEDLWAIGTMGFRGEALPSIASVSKVTLDTSNDIDSTHVQINYGKLISAQPGPCPKGTRIKVEELFYKTPARLKHLKSGNVEFNYILDLMQKMVLAHPEVAFSLSSDDKIRLQTNGSGRLDEVLLAVYGLAAAQSAVAFNCENYDFKVSGLLVLPQVMRSSKQYISLFMNQRLIRSYPLQKAVLEGYQGYSMPDRFPIAVINISADPHLIDVNVHPSKWEVRISKEKQLYDLIKNGISATLHRQMKPLDAAAVVAPPVSQSYLSQQTELFTSNQPVKVLQDQPAVPAEPIQAAAAPAGPVKTAKINALPTLSFLSQLHGRYILACDQDQLYIIDQHAAMERCMYEKIRTSVAESQIIQQPLLVPLVVNLTLTQMNSLDTINAITDTFGLHLEPFSNNSVIVRQIPLWMEDVDEQQFIIDLAQAIMDNSDMNLLAVRKEKIASLACHSSVKFNRHLNDEECRGLLVNLAACQQPFNCPHGRPTLIAISSQQLRKEFDRE